MLCIWNGMDNLTVVAIVLVSCLSVTPTRVYTYVYMCIFMHTCVYAYACTCVRTYAYAYAYASLIEKACSLPVLRPVSVTCDLFPFKPRNLTIWEFSANSIEKGLQQLLWF